MSSRETAPPDARSQDHDLLLGQVATEFFERLAAGENPRVEDYVQRHPQIADMIRHALPALQVVNDSIAGRTPQPAAEDRPVPVQTDQVGKEKKLGDFRILHELGRGGMGVVYEAEQLSMGERRVALKVLPFAAMVDDKQLLRFRNEVRAAASLDHPHIVSVYSIGEERGVHFYAMQLIKGQSLASLIHELRQLSNRQALNADSISQVISRVEPERLSLGTEPTLEHQATKDSEQATLLSGKDAETLGNTQHRTPTSRSTSQQGAEYHRSVAELAIQAARALEHAHERGVTHRDIKPANLMVDANADLFVTDFGLAHMEENVGVTMTGDLIGTLRYMSPEQAMSNRVSIDHRTDIYSLGITIYELLTTEYAFDGADRATLLRQIAFQELKPLRQIDRSIPRDLETIIQKAAAKNPEERYSSAKELADDLQAFLEHKTITAKPPTLLDKAGKLFWRNRTASLIAFLALITSVIGLSVSNTLIWRAKRNSEQNQARATSNLNLAFSVIDELLLEVLKEDRLLNMQGLGPASSQSVPARHAFKRRELDQIEKGLKLFEEIAQLNPDSPIAREKSANALLTMAILNMNLGNRDNASQCFDDAISRLELLAKDAAQNPDSLLDLARAKYHRLRCSHWWPAKREECASIIELTSQAIASGASQEHGFHLLGLCYVVQMDIREAIASLQRAHQINPDSFAITNSLADTYGMVGDERGARYRRKAVELAKAADLQHELERQLTKLGWGLLAKDKERAIETWRYASQIVISPLEQFRLECLIDQHQGNFSELIARCDRQLTREIPYSLAFEFRMHALADSGRREEALAAVEQDIRRIQRQGDSDEWGYYHVAELFAKLNLFAKAEEYYLNAIEKNPNNPAIRQRYAYCLFRRDKWEAALVEYDLCLQVTPTDGPSLENIVTCFERLGRAEEAVEHVERSLKTWPTPLAVRLLISLNSANEQVLVDDALEAYRSWTNENPEIVSNHRKLGEIYEAVKQGKLAIEAYETAYRIDPSDRDTCLRLADLLASEGNLKKAIEYHLDLRQRRSDLSSYDDYRLALLYLSNGDVDAHAKVCSRMLDRFADSASAEDIYLLCWTSALSRHASAPDFLALAEKRLSTSESSYKATHAACLYRAGRFEDAIDILLELSKDSNLKTSIAYNSFYLALAYQELENTTQAQRWAEKAFSHAKQELADPDCIWNRRLTLELLRKETSKKLKLH